MDGKMQGQFPIDLFQGAGGTSLNMNLNEVIANRANELLSGEKGYVLVHPNVHVNMGQSTNDVIPSAMKMTNYLYIKELLQMVYTIERELAVKVTEFSNVVKIARTCLQDAVPITLGQQFSGYHSFIKRQISELENLKDYCLTITLGATAVGTGLGTSPGYEEKVYEYLREVSEIPVMKNNNFFDGMQHADLYVKISAVLKGLATGLSTMAADFRLLSSGPRAGFSEITIPAVQPGSSIMPGKINPAMPEMMMQACFQVYGNDSVITMAVDRSEANINVWDNLIAKNLFESFELLTNGIELFTEKCVKGIQANKDVCLEYAESSLANSTVLALLFGYETASDIAKEAFKKDLSIKSIVIEKGLFTKEEADELFDPLMLADPSRNNLIGSMYKKLKQV